MTRAVVVVDGEHYPPVVRDAIAGLPYEVLGAWLAGGSEKLRETEPDYGVPLVTALKRGEIVGMQGDRALGHRGDVAVDFFGAPARFPIGPFLLARAAGVPVLPAFCVLQPDRRYRMTVQAPLRPTRATEDEALRRWVAGLATVIARYPTQWFNFFDPWSADAPR